MSDEYAVKKHIEKSYVLDFAIENKEDAVRFVVDNFHDLDREVFFTIQLDEDHKPINFSIQHMGSVDRSVISPKEIFKTALVSNCSGIILMHNHPGGTLNFSEPDIEVTKVLSQGARVLGLEVLDHYIFTPQKDCKSLYTETDIYKNVQSSLALEENTFDDIRVRQVIDDELLRKIEGPIDFIGNLIRLDNSSDDALVMTFLNNQNLVKSETFHSVSEVARSSKKGLVRDIFKQAIMNNATRLLIGSDKSKVSNWVELPVFLERIMTASKLFGIDILDIVAIEDGTIISILDDMGFFHHDRMVIEDAKEYIRENGLLDVINFDEVKHEDLFTIAKTIAGKDYKSFIKAFLSIEGNVNQKEKLDLAYELYVKDNPLAEQLDAFLEGIEVPIVLSHDEFLEHSNQLLDSLEGISYHLAFEGESADGQPFYSLIDRSAFHENDLVYLKPTVSAIARGDLSQSLLPRKTFVNDEALEKMINVFSIGSVLGDFSIPTVEHYLDNAWQAPAMEFIQVDEVYGDGGIEIGDVIVNVGRSVTLMSNKELGFIITSEIEEGSHYEVHSLDIEKDNYTLIALNQSPEHKIQVDREFLLQDINTNHNLVHYNSIEYKNTLGNASIIQWSDSAHEEIFNNYQQYFQNTELGIKSFKIEDVFEQGNLVATDRIVVKLNNGSGGHFSSIDTSDLSNLLKETLVDHMKETDHDLEVGVKP